MKKWIEQQKKLSAKWGCKKCKYGTGPELTPCNVIPDIAEDDSICRTWREK